MPLHHLRSRVAVQSYSTPCKLKILGSVVRAFAMLSTQVMKALGSKAGQIDPDNFASPPKEMLPVCRS
eukprot:6192792-Pleurochrysis_carterae.AAC.1